MGVISIAADAAAPILRGLMSGELEVRGILIGKTADKTFRYILHGLGDLSADPARLQVVPPLEPLRAALSVAHLVNIVGIAQNAALAATLKRIEGKLDAMERKLGDIETRLDRVETRARLVLEGTRSGPVSRLRAAKNAAVTARRSGDRTALILSAKDAEQAARDLLAQARHLVGVEEAGIPVALLLPGELSALAEGAAEAVVVATAVHLALGAADIAAGVADEAADAFADMRATLSRRLSDPELFLRRLDERVASDAEIDGAGRALHGAQHWMRGRAALIRAGLIEAGRDGGEFEAARPTPGIVFVEIAAETEVAAPQPDRRLAP